MSEIHRQHNEIDRSVSELLEIFHTDTQQKLHLAPMHSRPLLHSDTGIFQLADSGWPEDYDDLDQDDRDPHPADWRHSPAKGSEMTYASIDLTYADIRSATDRIGGAVRPVTVAPVDPGMIRSSGIGQCQVWLALEFMQYSGSVKVRGAQNFLATHREDDTLPGTGVAVAGGGNAALAFAWAAKATGVRATAFVSAAIPASRVAHLRSLGAHVLRVGDEADAFAASQTHADTSGALLVTPADDPLIAAGAGTLMDEIQHQIPGLDTIVIAVGSGNMLTGIATAANHHGIRTVAVEPVNSRAMNAALAASRLVEVEVDSIAADSLGARHVSAMALRAAQRFDVHSILVGDRDIIAARRALWHRRRVAVEYGAATPLAALITCAYQPRPGERVCVVLAGANTDLSGLG